MEPKDSLSTHRNMQTILKTVLGVDHSGILLIDLLFKLPDTYSHSHRHT